MQKKLIVMVLLAASAAHADDDKYYVVKPAPGREAVKPMKPDWCEAGHEVKSYCDANCQERTIRSAIQNDVGSGLQTDLLKVASIACDFPDSAYVQQQVAYWRQGWINVTGLTVKEEHDALKQAPTRDALDAAQAAFCKSLEPKAPDGTALYEQQNDIYYALGCSQYKKFLDPGWGVDTFKWMDRPDLPESAIARAFTVYGCLVNSPGGRDDAGYANCAGDVARLDRKKVEDEATALKLNALGRARALTLYGVAKARADLWTAALKKDPKTAKVLVDVPLAAYDGWYKTVYEPHKAAFDRAFAIEDKIMALDPNDVSHKPVTIGCEDLRKDVRDYIASKKPKAKKDVLEAAGDPVGYPLLVRLALCDGAEGRKTSAAAEIQVAKTQKREFLGPRMAAHWATIDAGIDEPSMQSKVSWCKSMEQRKDLAVERATFLSADPDRVSSLDEGTGDEGVDRSHIIDTGKVASVKATKDGLLVTFKKETWMAPTWSCTTSGKIVMFESDGTPVYSRDCKIVGQHQESFQLDPHVFDQASTTTKIKVGQIVKSVTAAEAVPGGALRGLVMEIDEPGKGKKTPTPLEYFGVPLSK